MNDAASLQPQKREFLAPILSRIVSLFFKPFSKSTADINSLDLNKLPEHIAIIMDGNRRWASRRGLPKVAGHRMGIEALRRTVNFCGQVGIKYLSVYTFSTENWQRPQSEVEFLMRLLEETISKEIDLLNKNNVRIKFLGNLAELPPKIIEEIKKAEEATKNNTKLTLSIMFNYGGQAEIIEAVKKICLLAKVGQIDSNQITPEIFANFLYTAGTPDPDLLIRTGGEERISNFLLWQSAYAEFWLTRVFWPDFGTQELVAAIKEFQKRQRRFGKI